MIVEPYKDKHPKIHESVFIADGVIIVGDVEIGEDSSVWFNTVIRGELSPVVIGKETNIQDGCMLHISSGNACIIGDAVTAGHHAVIHGANIGANTIVGIGSIVLDGAEIGEGSIVAAGSLVSPGKKFPPRSFILGMPGRLIREVTEEEYENNIALTKRYVVRAKEYKEAEERRS